MTCFVTFDDADASLACKTELAWPETLPGRAGAAGWTVTSVGPSMVKSIAAGSRDSDFSTWDFG